jgi:serine/threonine protein kinase
MEHEAYRPGAQVLGDWNIVSCLGAGSYGKVFEIERSEFGQTYRAALKVITVPQSSAEVRSVISEGMSVSQAEAYFHGIVEELMHEFSIMFKLKGTANIVSCEDLRVLEHPDGIGWDILIRMELLHPLLPYVYEHPMARRDIIRLGIDICKALELCQRYNVIHRDIKPENIFISDNGDYKLGDFGIARTIERTTSGLSKKGTYSYMAPEVYAGREYGFSVDTYSLGLVLYRMLNKNRGPFLPQPPEAITFSSREQALARRMSGEPLPRPFYGEGRLGEIVLKACAFDPKDRYSSPQQLRQELEAILYTQTDAAVIYPDGDELTMDRESYASARYAAAFGTSTSKSVSATQGVFTGDYHTKAEATSEERTQSAFGSEEPKGAGTKKKRKKIGRLIIGIVAAALLVPVVLCVIGAIPIPAAIHNIFVPQTIPEALREYEEAGTLEKLYENGILSGYRVETHGENGELDSVQIFDTAGNSIRNELYNSDGTLLGYVLYEYDVTGYCKRVDQYDNTGMIYSAYEIDSDGNEVKREIYTDGRLTQTWITEYDDAGNMVQSEVYIGGTLRYVNEYDQAGNLIRIESYDDNGDLFGYGLYEYDSDGNQIKEESYDPDGTLEGYTLYEYDSNGNWLKSENYDPDGTLNRYTLFEWDVNGTKTRQETYSADDELLNYWELNDVGEWVDYNADGTPVE